MNLPTPFGLPGVQHMKTGMKKLEWLEAMRGGAALWVLLHHSVLAAIGFVGPLGPPFIIFSNGFLGVDFFFVLSGFIISTSSKALLDSGAGLREYATARVLRIYVPYFPIGVAMLLLYAALPGVSQGDRSSVSVVSSLTLMPSNLPPALSVAWTLVHEMLFYALFSVLFLSRRLLLVLLILWSAGIAVTAASGVELSRLAGYFLSPLNLCFVLGVAVSWATRKGVGNRLALLVGVAGFLMVGSQAVSAESPNRVLVALGFAGLVAAARAPWPMAVSPGRFLLLLGAASYSIYLVQNIAISVLVRLARRVGDPVTCLVLVALGGLLLGILYHLLYEKASLRWARRRIDRRLSKAAPAT
jgi:exopolysaccharide production protein ExoZ